MWFCSLNFLSTSQGLTSIPSRLESRENENIEGVSGNFQFWKSFRGKYSIGFSANLSHIRWLEACSASLKYICFCIFSGSINDWFGVRE